jgi:hypothetical protein
MVNEKYGKQIPDSFILNEYDYCPGLANEYLLSTSILSPANQLFRRVIDQAILDSSLGGKAYRNKAKKSINYMFPQILVMEYGDYIDSIINYITEIRKDFAIVDYNAKIPILDETVPAVATVDLVYTRKTGACYSIIMTDISIRQMPIYLEHILVRAASIIDIDKDVAKNIEIVIPTRNKMPDRFLLEINKNYKEYLDFNYKTLYNLAQRYYVDKELYSNFSNKCLWCSQKSVCTKLRHASGISRSIAESVRRI